MRAATYQDQGPRRPVHVEPRVVRGVRTAVRTAQRVPRRDGDASIGSDGFLGYVFHNSRPALVPPVGVGHELGGGIERGDLGLPGRLVLDLRGRVFLSSRLRCDAACDGRLGRGVLVSPQARELLLF